MSITYNIFLCPKCESFGFRYTDDGTQKLCMYGDEDVVMNDKNWWKERAKPCPNFQLKKKTRSKTKEKR